MVNKTPLLLRVGGFFHCFKLSHDLRLVNH
nr:MAG TPA: hypothetical protein [Caudoviricetes sp.]